MANVRCKIPKCNDRSLDEVKLNVEYYLEIDYFLFPFKIYTNVHKILEDRGY